MKRAKSSLLIIALLALATFVLVAGVLTAAQKKAPVIVAAHALETGTKLGPNDVEVRHIHASSVLEGAFKTPEEVIGGVITVQRLPGDQVTADMVGDAAQNALAQGLDPDHRAVAVHVDRASGLAGLLRPGDTVSAIAIVDPSTWLGTGPTAPGMGVQNTGAGAKVMLTGLKVLFVPWEFRYRELNTVEDDAGMAPVMATSSGREDGVVVLSAPLAPITVTWALTPTPSATQSHPSITDTARVTATVGLTDTNTMVDPSEIEAAIAASDNINHTNPTVRVSPVELLALLDARATLYLVLEPSQEEAFFSTPGVFLNTLMPDEIFSFTSTAKEGIGQ